MTIRTQAAVWMDADIDVAFKAATDPESISAAFDGLFPIPGIDRIENPSSGPFEVGLVRIIVNADGTRIREQMTRVDVPTGQSYELSEFTGPFKFLVSGAGGNWTLREGKGCTHVTWEFWFEPLVGRSIIVKTLAPIFQRAQLNALRKMAAALP